MHLSFRTHLYGEESVESLKSDIKQMELSINFVLVLRFYFEKQNFFRVILDSSHSCTEFLRLGRWLNISYI